MEIAKLRAARLLWAEIVKKSGAKSEENCVMKIHSRTSSANKSPEDPNQNMLMATTEAMSAIIGGCDELCILPFDTSSESGEIESNRLAKNTQLMLREESYLDKIIDPSSGSYYIEKLTAELAERALTLFNEKTLTDYSDIDLQGISPSKASSQDGSGEGWHTPEKIVLKSSYSKRRYRKFRTA